MVPHSRYIQWIRKYSRRSSSDNPGCRQPNKSERSDHWMKVVPITTYMDEDRGNLKDRRCRQRIKEVSKHYGGYDIIIVDAGEFSPGFAVNRAFWLGRIVDGVNLRDALVDLLPTLKKGGKIAFKMNGVWDGCFSVLHMLTKNFREVKAIKLGVYE